MGDIHKVGVLFRGWMIVQPRAQPWFEEFSRLLVCELGKLRMKPVLRICVEPIQPLAVDLSPLLRRTADQKIEEHRRLCLNGTWLIADWRHKHVTQPRERGHLRRREKAQLRKGCFLSCLDKGDWGFRVLFFLFWFRCLVLCCCLF